METSNLKQRTDMDKKPALRKARLPQASGQEKGHLAEQK